MKKKLVVPKFENEKEESMFWANLDLAEYFEPSDFKRGVVFPSLKRTKRLIAKAKETTGDALLRLAKLGKKLQVKAPADLSSQIDDYLYGEVSEVKRGV